MKNMKLITNKLSFVQTNKKSLVIDSRVKNVEVFTVRRGPVLRISEDIFFTVKGNLQIILGLNKRSLGIILSQ